MKKEHSDGDKEKKDDAKEKHESPHHKHITNNEEPKTTNHEPKTNDEEKEDPKWKKNLMGSDMNLVYAIVAIIALLALVFSAGYFYTEKQSYETVTYNNFEFTKVAGMWFFDWQKEDALFSVPLRYNPYQVENVTIEGRLSDSFNRKEVYVTFDPESNDTTFLTLGATELTVNMAKAIDVKPIASCTKNATEDEVFDFCFERPILECEKGKSVIYMKTSDRTQITLNDECIILEGKGFELLRSIDRLLYQWYGVMS